MPTPLSELLDDDYEVKTSRVEEDVNSLLRELSVDSDIDMSIQVWRMAGPGNKANKYLFSLEPDDYKNYSELLDHLRDTFEGGDFKIRIKRGDEVITKTVSVESVPKQKLEPTQTAPDLTQWFEKILERQERSTEKMIGMLTQAIQHTAITPAIDPMDLYSKMIQSLVQARDVFSHNDKSANTPDMLGQFKNFLELQSLIKTTAGDTEANTNDVIVSLIENLAPPLVEAVQRSQAVATLPKSQPAPKLTQGTQSSQQSNEMAFKSIWKSQLISLCASAKKGSNPQLWAAVVLDKTPESGYQQLIDFITRPDVIDQLAAIHPDVKNYEDWFRQLAGAIIDEFEEVPEGEENVSGTIDGAANGNQPGETWNVTDLENHVQGNKESQT